MSNINSTADKLNFEDGESNVIPSGLNVLTILTFIGCGIGIILVLAATFINNFFLKMMDQSAASGREFTTQQLTDMQKGRAAIELSQANIIPLVIIGILSIVLCFVGALWMRKLKKDGFWIYTAGEILPLIGNLILLGIAQFTGILSLIISIGLPLIFIGLYSLQRKYLIYK